MKDREEIVRELNAQGATTLPGYLGIELHSLTQGGLCGRMEVTQNHLAANGYLHAASVIALADTCCGNATIAHLPEDSVNFTTVELKSNFLGSVLEGVVNCVATAQHMGRTTQVWDAVVTAEKTGKTIAIFRCTQMVLWPNP